MVQGRKRDFFTIVVNFDRQFVEKTTSAQETGAVSGGVVGETGFETEALELLGVGRRDNAITLDADMDDLSDDLGVGTTDAETILSGVVLVLLLVD